MDGFFGRLKERKLVQWALAYAAAAFALLQVIDIVAQRFGWPESIERGLIVVLAVGFFVTIVLAWFHGERGAQRVTGTELLILALLLAVGGGLLWRMEKVPQNAAATDSTKLVATLSVAIPDKSIAVLPLIDESGEKDQQYFSDGLSEDLITALSQFAGLKVIGRNSSFQFRDKRLARRVVPREVPGRRVRCRWCRRREIGRGRHGVLGHRGLRVVVLAVVLAVVLRRRYCGGTGYCGGIGYWAGAGYCGCARNCCCGGTGGCACGSYCGGTATSGGANCGGGG